MIHTRHDFKIYTFIYRIMNEIRMDGSTHIILLNEIRMNGNPLYLHNSTELPHLLHKSIRKCKLWNQSLKTLYNQHWIQYQSSNLVFKKEIDKNETLVLPFEVLSGHFTTFLESYGCTLLSWHSKPCWSTVFFIVLSQIPPKVWGFHFKSFLLTFQHVFRGFFWHL